jgi:hypothetical protein
MKEMFIPLQTAKVIDSNTSSLSEYGKSLNKHLKGEPH